MSSVLAIELQNHKLKQKKNWKENLLKIIANPSSRFGFFFLITLGTLMYVYSISSRLFCSLLSMSSDLESILKIVSDVVPNMEEVRCRCLLEIDSFLLLFRIGNVILMEKIWSGSRVPAELHPIWPWCHRFRTQYILLLTKFSFSLDIFFLFKKREKNH